MPSLLEGVDQRTKLAGHNRLELLLFKLTSNQRFGINVFKVQEVIQCPPLVQLPKCHPVICGVAHLRGKTIPVMDLSMAIGARPQPRDGSGYVIITEYNRSTQGFLVNTVDRIINMGWHQIQPPPKGTGKETYLTAVTQFEKELIEVIDVEKIMKEVMGGSDRVSSGVIDENGKTPGQHVLVVDDSFVARNQILRVLEQLEVESTVAKDGQEALDILERWKSEGRKLSEFLAMIISDIEMPRMDGYTLTANIRKDPAMKDLHILLHTSLSGVFNQAMVEKVGADEFLAKYDPDELARVVQQRLKEHAEKGHGT
ncbi:chemotaxis protein CheV [Methylocaldum szegediense]|uniref:Two-component system, chemotaxis family, chemotaxis protein CheV n=1 Tax=Methylocaldum szegediense TaxID=73780 RepID=A0ABM9I090_9GAMM|nr:chemotaxis protein CheV [Methylocaldum szegediense]CAI8804603.1 two-component system, chemotaxis family, chemotaxis protein CheV [Methylocaldum szegediense]